METSTNLGRVSLVPRGAYDPAADYVRLDVVEYEGSSYLALRAVRGVTPEDGADYMLLARRGGQGEKGNTGDAGPAGPAGKGFTIRAYYQSLDELEGAVPAPEEGDNYGVGAEAPYDIYTWDKEHRSWVSNGTIQGPQGLDGKSAYQYAVDGGYPGTEAEFQALMADAATKQYIDGNFVKLGEEYPQECFRLGSFVLEDDQIIGIDGLKDGYGELRFDVRDPYVLIRGAAEPEDEHDVANKGYVDGLIGQIGERLDAINGEVV